MVYPTNSISGTDTPEKLNLFKKKKVNKETTCIKA